MMDKELLEAALAARERAYAPYSKFLVGAAVRAERNALFNAVGAGERKFTALCVVGDTEEPISPCGACRQVMAEFKVPCIILANLQGDVKEYTLEELLPYGFTL